MIDTDDVRRLIAAGESMTVEFKGERRGRLPDRYIYEAVVCLANADGGVILIGVEDDRSLTGARPRHGSTTEPHRVHAAISNNTVPPVMVDVSLHSMDGVDVLAIKVEPQVDICATTDGKCVRRTMGIQGPECQPFFPFQHASRRSDLRLVDHSAQLIPWARWSDIDPLEVERLRQTIERLDGDRVLLGLDDEALVQALKLVESRPGEFIPNVAGMLLLGREESLRQAVPTHAVAFQVLDERTNVSVNDWHYGSILRTLEAVEQRFRTNNQEREVTVGLFRLPVPDYALDAFREAVNNAILHRDYSRLGTVFIQFTPDQLQITNPGGFLEGITLDNLLVHEPKPRNPRLAEAFRRIGLVETTGRGIDRIYTGQLRYGRPQPDYSQSDRESVRLILRGGETSLAFSAFVHEQDRAGHRLQLDDLLVLNHLQHERRIDARTAAQLTQRGDARARSILEGLVERGLIESQRDGRERVYHLSARVYQEMGMPAEYVRMRGFGAIRQESMVLEYIAAHGRITRREVVQLCNLSDRDARNLLRRMVRDDKLQPRGERRGSYYVTT